MTFDEIKVAEVEALDARVDEIRSAMNEENADCVELEKEFDAIESRKAELRAAAKAHADLAEKIASGEEGEETRNFEKLEGETNMEENRVFERDSNEYRIAFLKYISGRDNEMNDAEKRTMTTGIGGSVSPLVPTQIENNIWDLVFAEHPILADVRRLRANTIIEIPVHTASAGAEKPAEGSAPSAEETNTFDTITIAGVDYAKYVNVSYAMADMAIDALEEYLEYEIAKAISEKLADDAVTNIATAATAVSNNVSYTILNGLAYQDICDAFALLKRVKNVVVYASAAMIYGSLVGMVGTDGHPIFQLVPQDDAVGFIFGAKVKIEESVGANKLLIGDPSKAVLGVVRDVEVESDRDIKAHVKTYSGYMRAEAQPVDPYAFCAVVGS